MEVLEASSFRRGRLSQNVLPVSLSETSKFCQKVEQKKVSFAVYNCANDDKDRKHIFLQILHCIEVSKLEVAQTRTLLKP